MDLVYPPVLAVARTYFFLQGAKFTISGSENVPRRGGAVMAMNHLSYLDYAYAGLPAIRRGRVVRWMAKKEIFDTKVGGPLMRGMKHISVDRARGNEAYQEAVERLRAGQIVGVFPEATISRSLELKAFKTGAVRMAMDAGVPVLPTIGWGNHRVWTKDHPKKLGRTNYDIYLSVGEPLRFEAGTDPVVATERLRESMTTLLHAAQDAYPAMPESDRAFLPVRLGGTAPTPEEADRLDAEEKAERARKKAARDR